MLIGPTGGAQCTQMGGQTDIGLQVGKINLCEVNINQKDKISIICVKIGETLLLRGFGRIQENELEIPVPLKMTGEKNMYMI